MKALQRFLGVVNFFRRFIRSALVMFAPLTNALKLSPKEFTWTPSMATAFSAAKEALASGIFGLLWRGGRFGCSLIIGQSFRR